MSKLDLQRRVMKYLESKNILCFSTRSHPLLVMTSGDPAETGSRGLADILAFYRSRQMGVIPVWLEINTSRRERTTTQKRFRALVESQKHIYVVVRSITAAKEFFE